MSSNAATIEGQLARHGGLLVNTDARELVARVPDDSVSIVYLDPPYGSMSATDHAVEELRDLLADVVQEARRVLAPTGNLFYTIPPAGTLSADAFDARFVLKQVFRQDPWEISRPLPPLRGRFSGPRSDREVTLWVRASEEATYNPPVRERSDAEIKREFPREDERGRYRSLDLTVPGQRPALQFEWDGVTPPGGRSWRVSRERMQALAEEGRIEATRRSLRLKHYVDEAPPRGLPTEWDDLPRVLARAERDLGSKRIAGQKPLDFTTRLVEMGSNPGSLIFDPFCGTGPTLVAARESGRRWIGGDLSPEAVEIAAQRLVDRTGLTSDDWLVERDTFASFPSFSSGQAPLLTHVGQVEELQRKVGVLFSQFHEIQTTLAGGDPDEIIDTLEARIQSFLDAEAPPSHLEGYVRRVKAWLAEWELLDEMSRLFLPQAEFLMDTLGEDSDYSPFVIQYCKVLENELLLKLFVAYSLFLDSQADDDKHALIVEGLGESSTKLFAKKLSTGDTKYTLGQMMWVMNLIKKPGGKTLGNSKLLQHFRDFTGRYFSDRVRDEEYLGQIERIQNDYRNKAAHPYLLDLQAGLDCQRAVRVSLREFLQSYQSSS